jgi:hypothetical protein
MEVYKSNYDSISHLCIYATVRVMLLYRTVFLRTVDSTPSLAVGAEGNWKIYNNLFVNKHVCRGRNQRVTKGKNIA